MNQRNSKGIAKNTMLLYFRMLLTMLVSLYTVRLVLDTLGVIDYGIYNVVGGVVTMLSFLSSTMSSACQRFFSFELGKGDTGQLRKIFGGSLTVFIVIALLIFILLETVGLWFLNYKMVIPVDRLDSANWVYQFAILSFLLTVIVNPYNAIIIAHEDMDIYAYISIIEVILKLVIVYLLLVFAVDKLKLYAILSFAATFLVSIMYISFSLFRYKACRGWCVFEKKIVSPIASYAGWNMIGAVANIFKINGTNIILNLFYGPIVNSARAIAIQVNNVFNNFITNFYMAVRPQITKSYAAGDKEYFTELIFKSAKASYFLLLILSIPLLFEIDFILSIWLKETPQYTVIFIRLLIINLLVESINNQLVAALQATGKIRLYQLIVSGLLLFNLPASYFYLKLGGSPEGTLYISIFITLITFIPQFLITKKIVGLSILDYLKNVVAVVLLVTILSYILPFLVTYYMPDSLFRFSLVSIGGIIMSLIFIYNIGMSSTEKTFLINIIKRKLRKNHESI